MTKDKRLKTLQKRVQDSGNCNDVSNRSVGRQLIKIPSQNHYSPNSQFLNTRKQPIPDTYRHSHYTLTDKKTYLTNS